MLNTPVNIVPTPGDPLDRWQHVEFDLEGNEPIVYVYLRPGAQRVLVYRDAAFEPLFEQHSEVDVDVVGGENVWHFRILPTGGWKDVPGLDAFAFDDAVLPMDGPGAMWYQGEASDVLALPAPAAGDDYVLAFQDGATAPSWVLASTLGGGSTLPTGGEGSIWYEGPAAAITRLAAGTEGQVLTAHGAAAPTWETPAAGGGTLDASYDFGGAGAGRAITVDANAVQLLGNAADNNNVLEVQKQPAGAQSGDGLSVSLNANATGRAGYFRHDGLGSAITGMSRGIAQENATDATSGATLQYPGGLEFIGRAWNTNGAGASHSVAGAVQLAPISGDPVAGVLQARFDVNGAGYGTAVFQVFSDGAIRSGKTDGDLANAAYSWTNDSNTGLVRAAADAPAMAAGGVEAMRWTTTTVVSKLNLVPDATNSRDLGGSSLRWNNIYGGDLSLSRDAVLTGGVTCASVVASGSVGAGSLSAADLAITDVVATSGNPGAFVRLTGAAHTGLTAGAEILDLDIALNRTVQRATGAVATQRAVVVRAPTYSFVGASTITDAATVAITGAPVAGANATITNPYALWVQAGKTRLDGQVLAAAAGDSGTPAFAAVSDPDTGLHFPGSDVLTLACGGADAAYVKTDGFVAINGLRFNDAETTTKIYRSAANTVSIDISGTERFKLNASGALFGRQVYSTPVTITDGASLSWDASVSNIHEVTLAGTGRTFTNPSNLAKGMSGHIYIVQDGTGNRTITTWNSAFDFGAEGTPTLSTGAGKVDVVSWVAISTSVIRCSFNKAAA